MKLSKIGLGVAMLLVAGCAGMSGGSMGGAMLSGSQEAPSVTTQASGTSTIVVAADKSVSGTVTTTGITATAAHIHMAAMGQNGPVVVPLTKTGDSMWSVAAGAKLTDAQYDAYKAGNLYVNVHSADNKAGELRAQLKP